MILVDGVPWDPADGRIRPDAEGVLYGRGLFETIRWRQGRALLLDWHLARMAGSAAALDIGWPAQLERELEGWITLAVGDLPAGGEAALRLTLLATQPPSPPTAILSARAHRPLPPSDCAAGVALTISEHRIFSGDPLRRHKSCNYLFNHWIRGRARAAGAYDAVLLDEHGRVWETTAANLYLLRGRQLWTPPTSGPMLPGIARRFLLERVLPDTGLELREREIDQADLEGADGAFVTNALIGVLPVARIGSVRLAVPEPIANIGSLLQRRLMPTPRAGEMA